MKKNQPNVATKVKVVSSNPRVRSWLKLIGVRPQSLQSELAKVYEGARAPELQQAGRPVVVFDIPAHEHAYEIILAELNKKLAHLLSLRQDLQAFLHEDRAARALRRADIGQLK